AHRHELVHVGLGEVERGACRRRRLISKYAPVHIQWDFMTPETPRFGGRVREVENRPVHLAARVEQRLAGLRGNECDGFVAAPAQKIRRSREDVRSSEAWQAAHDLECGLRSE